MKERVSNLNNLAPYKLLSILLLMLAQSNFAQAQDADRGEVTNDDLIMGVMGEGTLIVFIFIILALVICFFREMTQCPNLCIVLAGALPVLVLIILMNLPKEEMADRTSKSLPPEDPYLITASLFLTIVSITFCCALCCLCNVQFRATEVRRLDSEIGNNMKLAEEEFSGLVVGGPEKEPPKHDKLENRSAASNRNSDAGSRRGEDSAGAGAGNEGGSMSSIWPEDEAERRVPRRVNLNQSAAIPVSDIIMDSNPYRSEEEHQRLSLMDPRPADIEMPHVNHRPRARRSEFQDY